jgi:hypothetical protein
MSAILRPATGGRPRTRLRDAVSPKWIRHASATTSLVTIVLGTGCGDGDGGTGPQQAASVAISPADARLIALGDTVRLRAQVRDRHGAAIEQAAVAWNSLDPALATVDATGLVRAVAIGTARITAAVSGISATANVAIEQEVASIAVDPAFDTLMVGASVVLRAEGRDRNGAAVANARFTWSSSDATIASVDSAGRVTARRRGAAVITARSGGPAGSTDFAVVLPELHLARDTTLHGVVEVARFEIPAGVTTTVRDSLRLLVDDDVVIAGTLIGDCVRIDVRGGGALRVAGRVTNACTDSINGEGAPLRLVVNGTITLDDAEIVASGELDLSNDPPAGGAAGSAVPTRSLPGSAARVDTADCNIGGRLVLRPSRPGRAGSPNGEDGQAGRPLNITCRDKLVLRADVAAGAGGRGGRGDATPSDAGIGGEGGVGGDISIVAGNGIDIGTAGMGGGFSATIRAGVGGNGGDAEACTGDRRPVALAGHGGDAGSIRVRTLRGEIRILTSPAVWFVPGDGGSARACGRSGSDAGATPAEPGQDAAAEGGNAGQAGRSPQIRLLEDVFVAPNVVGEDRIQLVVVGGNGGSASVVSGNGGKGNATYPDGANGGAMRAEGGRGGQSWIWDDRAAAFEPANPRDGEFLGGNATFGRANGGDGFGDCQLPGDRGGAGGRGGDASGSAGAPGRAGPNATGKPGKVRLGIDFSFPVPTGNGGNGGDGSPPGAGGAAGQDGTNAVGEVELSNERLFTPGSPGNPCPGTGIRVGAVIREGNIENIATIEGFGASARIQTLTTNTNAAYFFDRVAATPAGDIVAGERNGATGAESVVRYPGTGGPGVTLLANANEPMPRAGDGALLFTRDVNGSRRVWGSSASGAGATLFPDIGADMYAPVWRGTGSFLTWTCSDDICKILLVGIASGQGFPLTPTTPGANNRDPALCGDINTMVYASSDALGRDRIEKMNLMTGVRTPISMPPVGYNDRYPACSPDARYEMWTRFAPDGTSRLIIRDREDNMMYDIDKPGAGLYKAFFVPII